MAPSSEKRIAGLKRYLDSVRRKEFEFVSKTALISAIEKKIKNLEDALK